MFKGGYFFIIDNKIQYSWLNLLLKTMVAPIKKKKKSDGGHLFLASMELYVM